MKGVITNKHWGRWNSTPGEQLIEKMVGLRGQFLVFADKEARGKLRGKKRMAYLRATKSERNDYNNGLLTMTNLVNKRGGKK